MSDLRIAAQQALEALDYIEHNYMSLPATAEKAITALRAALAQQAEPVAWMESPHGAIRANPNYRFTFPSQLLHWQIPLYTAPPQRKPLSEEEIRTIGGTYSIEVWADDGWSIDFARAIEHAHGIK